jgi:polyferredoxin
MNMPESDNPPSKLAPHVWARYWRLMRWMALAAIAAVIVSLAWLARGGGLMTIHMIIATVAGVGVSVLLAAALMLLVFMSAGSGHDEDVARTSDADHWNE